MAGWPRAIKNSLEFLHNPLDRHGEEAEPTWPSRISGLLRSARNDESVGYASSIDKAGMYKMYLSICNSAPSEVLALIALRSKDKLLKRNREIVLRNLALLDSFMMRHRHQLSWVRPQSGTTGLVELLLPIPIEQFTESLVEKTGILIMPGSVFGVPGNFFRIGFGRSNLPEIIERFEQYLDT